MNTRTATPVDAQTNPFCAGGMHLPNGSYAVFGGNTAIGPGGDNSAPNSTEKYDPYYDDFDGTRAIRMITPCDGDLTAAPCAWDDSQNGLQMLKHRWYPGVEPLADGTVVLIGGFRQGGYINREYPNVDPTYEVNKSEPTYEFFPPTGQDPPILKFVVDTSGLNSFPLTYLMPSGKMFVQANYSTSYVSPSAPRRVLLTAKQCSGTTIQIPRRDSPTCQVGLYECILGQQRMLCCH